MHYSSDRRVFISWGNGVAPLISASGTPYCDHYLVSRGLMGDGSDAVVIGRTRAEMFLDENVVPSRVYHYCVYAAGNAASTESKDVAHFTVTTKARPPQDFCAPTTPLGLQAKRKARAIEWSWCPSQKTPASRLLGYFVEDGDTPQSRGFIFELHGATQKWHEPVGARGRRLYRLRAIDKDLNISEPTRVVLGQAGGGLDEAYGVVWCPELSLFVVAGYTPEKYEKDEDGDTVYDNGDPPMPVVASPEYCIATSSDGQAWTYVEVSEDTVDHGYGVAWDGTTIVVGGYSVPKLEWDEDEWVESEVVPNAFCYSTDGASWTGISESTDAPSKVRGIVYGDDQFVAVGEERENGPVGVPSIARSAGGVSWSPIEASAEKIAVAYAVAWSGSRYVAVGLTLMQNDDITLHTPLAYSADGASWTYVSASTLKLPVTVFNSGWAWSCINDVEWNGSEFVIGFSSRVMSSGAITGTRGARWAHILSAEPVGNATVIHLGVGFPWSTEPFGDWSLLNPGWVNILGALNQDEEQWECNGSHWAEWAYSEEDGYTMTLPYSSSEELPASWRPHKSGQVVCQWNGYVDWSQSYDHEYHDSVGPLSVIAHSTDGVDWEHILSPPSTTPGPMYVVWNGTFGGVEYITWAYKPTVYAVVWDGERFVCQGSERIFPSHDGYHYPTSHSLDGTTWAKLYGGSFVPELPPCEFGGLYCSPDTYFDFQFKQVASNGSRSVAAGLTVEVVNWSDVVVSSPVAITYSDDLETWTSVDVIQPEWQGTDDVVQTFDEYGRRLT